MIKRHRRTGRTTRVALCGLTLSAALAAPSAHGATIVPTPSTWIPVAPKQVFVSGVAVHANSGIILTEESGDAGTTRKRRMLIVRRHGTTTGGVRRKALPDDIGSIVAVTADQRGRWLVLSAPAVIGTPQYDTGRLTRLTAQGAVDGSFGVKGTAPVSGIPIGVTTDSSDRPVILTSPSTPSSNGSATALVTRLTSSGRPDEAFGTGGSAVGPEPTARAAAIMGAPVESLIVAPRAVATTATDRILVSGMITDVSTGSIGYLAELTASGAPDAAFGTGDGTVTYGPLRKDPLIVGGFGRPLSVDRLRGGIYVVGRPNASDRDLTWKRTARGLRDASYGTLGWSRPAVADPNMQGTATIQGSALCTSGFVWTTARQIRVTTRTGRPDTSYGRRGVVTVPEKSPLGQIDAAAADVRRCPTNYLATSAQVRRGKGGITLIWLSLPTPATVP